ncbi:MAG: hypothetical protein JWP69_1610 [Flaviaesturariibacter sp.]|nr:hypothetical protein [Flaviaesturariibacter sp.]
MKIFCTITIVLLSNYAVAQEYMFVASYRPKGDGCYDRILKQIPLEKASQYDSLRRNFYTDYKASSADMFLLKPQQPSIVYSFKTKILGFSCEYLAHGIAYGATIEEATVKMKETAAKNPRNFLTPPDIAITWQGNGSSKQTLKKDYKNGVEIEYILAKQQSGKTVMLIKAVNRNKELDVVVKFKSSSQHTGMESRGEIVTEISISAGGGVSGSIPAGIYDVDFEFKPKEGAPMEVKKSIMDYMKKKTKEVIGVDKDGKIIDNRGGSGIRG